MIFTEAVGVYLTNLFFRDSMIFTEAAGVYLHQIVFP